MPAVSPLMCGVTVTVVDIVEVIAVLDRLMAAVGTVRVCVIAVFGVDVAVALVPVTVVFDMRVAVVEVVDVIVVRHCGVTAVGPVRMGMVVVGRVGLTHVVSSWTCRSASVAIWET